MELTLLHVLYATLKENRDERMWMLKDLLVIAGEPPLTAHTMDACSNEYVLVKKKIPVRPCVVGTSTQTLHLNLHTGLPNWLSIDERRYLRLAIINALNNKTITWTEPVQTYAQMKLTLVDKQQPMDCAQRLAKVILRAMPRFHGKPAFDTVKIAVEEDNRRIRRYFGKCLAFFKDSNEEMFVAIRWYETAESNANRSVLIDPIAKLAKLKLSPVANSRSYGIMPISSIENGALIIRMNDHYWALQSPREQAEYLKNI